MFLPKKNRVSYWKKEIIDRLAVLMGDVLPRRYSSATSRAALSRILSRRPTLPAAWCANGV